MFPLDSIRDPRFPGLFFVTFAVFAIPGALAARNLGQWGPKAQQASTDMNPADRKRTVIVWILTMAPAVATAAFLAVVLVYCLQSPGT